MTGVPLPRVKALPVTLARRKRLLSSLSSFTSERLVYCAATYPSIFFPLIFFLKKIQRGSSPPSLHQSVNLYYKDFFSHCLPLGNECYCLCSPSHVCPFWHTIGSTNLLLALHLCVRYSLVAMEIAVKGFKSLCHEY